MRERALTGAGTPGGLAQVRSAALCLGVFLAAGCYHVGHVPPAGIRHIAVPVFRNETFPLERDLELDLTREVRRRIEEQTDLVLVSDQKEADAVLEGTVGAFRESVAAEDRLDRPVRSYAFATVSIRLRKVGDPRRVLFQDVWNERTAFMASTGGDTARQDLVRRIADRIVALALSNWEEP